MQRFGGRVVAVDPEDAVRRPARGEPPSVPADAPPTGPTDGSSAGSSEGSTEPPPDADGPGGDSDA
jgi:hypothetical protein